MAGYSELYCIGGDGGFASSDGINPIVLQILVGDADRQWWEPHYFVSGIAPLGGIRRMIPAGPKAPNTLLDACLVFYPDHFRGCPSLGLVEQALRGKKILDFDRDGEPAGWSRLREEAVPLLATLGLWRARLERVESQLPGE